MNIPAKVWSRKKRGIPPEEVLSVTRSVRFAIDRTARDIFVTYRQELLSESMTHIVPAVWGTAREGELTSVQKEINNRVLTVLRETAASLRLEKLDPLQRCAFDSFVRWIIVTQVTFFMESFRNRLHQPAERGGMKEDLLHAEPRGHA